MLEPTEEEQLESKKEINADLERVISGEVYAIGIIFEPLGEKDKDGEDIFQPKIFLSLAGREEKVPMGYAMQTVSEMIIILLNHSPRMIEKFMHLFSIQALPYMMSGGKAGNGEPE